MPSTHILLSAPNTWQLLAEFSGSIIQGKPPEQNIWQALKSFKEPVGMAVEAELPVSATVQAPPPMLAEASASLHSLPLVGRRPCCP